MRTLRIYALLILLTWPLAATEFEVEELADGLNFPWSMAFLPGGDFIITEKAGDLLRLSADGKSRTVIKNMPRTLVKGQGGLQDVILDTNFITSGKLFISYASGDGDENYLKVISAVLRDNELTDIQVILTTEPGKSTTHHYGARMALLADDTLVVTVGDGYSYRNQAQMLDNHFGKVLRINKDGSIPEDNPFLDTPDAKPEIFSYGHRNPQAILVDGSGQIWSHEHGAKGGDELNIIRAGLNYGWPAITHGIDYSGALISPFSEAEGMEQPVTYWTPSIAPAGMTLYNGNAFPDWQGNLFIASLAERTLRRLSISDNQVTNQEVMLKERNERLRDVRTGSDGFIYILTDSSNGKLLRLKPLD
jgi:glucose/arabinose dehydrogenase